MSGSDARSDERLTASACLATVLASLSLLPLFDSWLWLAPVALTVAVVSLVGGVARATSWPSFLAPLAQGVAILVVTAEVFARDHLWGGWLPTPDTLPELRAVLQSGLADSVAFGPPVPTTAGLVALAMAGVGLIALAVDVLAVTLRLPTLAGAPLLAVYVVPSAVIAGGAPWWAFLPAAAGWLVLLAADARASTREWGPAVGAPPGPLARGTTARRVGALAMLLALALPLALPGLPEQRLGTETAGAGGQGRGGVSVNPLVSLKRDYLDPGDRDVIVVSSESGTAPYLRLTTLDRFDGTAWSAPDLVPAPDRELNAGFPGTVDGLAGQGALPRRDVTVRVGDLEGPYLPMPVPAVGQTAGEGWFADPASGTVFSDRLTSRGTEYTVTALDLGVDAAAMRTRARLATDSLVPAQPPVVVPDLAVGLAQRVAGGADNPFDAAVALQDWFRSEFRYSIDVRSGSDSAYLEEFLTDRVGYCEQFAAAMALMARSLGIPSRVAVGFAPGRATGPGTWTVSAHDAHAWPELWIPGAGWTRFEPTPRSGDGSAVAPPSYARPPTPSATASTGSQAASGPSRTPRRSGAPEADRGDGPTAGAEAAGPSPWPALLIIAGLAALAVLPLVVRGLRRRRRLSAGSPRQVALGAWDDLRDTALDYGRTWPAADTPRQTGRRLLAGSPLRDGRTGDVGGAVGRLVAGVEAAAYAEPAGPWSGPSADELRTDLRTVRESLRRRTSGWERWRAVLLPGSVIGRAGRGRWGRGGTARESTTERGEQVERVPERV